MPRQAGRGAHPRSRGENPRRGLASGSRAGSSPLTRGKPCDHPPPARRSGLIPAHAGKTPHGASRASATQAHPRSRGENPIDNLCGSKHLGSSPLTRGKPFESFRQSVETGLIPAHAGKTSGGEDCFALAGAHPRSRGENHTTTLAPIGASGSSPLTRGKLAAAGVIGMFGLIPAHAGKTSVGCSASRRTWAHPRSRGENARSRCLASGRRGSSPLTRGKQARRLRRRRASRLIPAHAGKTSPRPIRVGVFVGSSPLTRGKRRLRDRLPARSGLIPAHAGKTSKPDTLQATPQAHPRSRGENKQAGYPTGNATGSSPLTRGKPGP